MATRYPLLRSILSGLLILALASPSRADDFGDPEPDPEPIPPPTGGTDDKTYVGGGSGSGFRAVPQAFEILNSSPSKNLDGYYSAEQWAKVIDDLTTKSSRSSHVWIFSRTEFLSRLKPLRSEELGYSFLREGLTLSAQGIHGASSGFGVRVSQDITEGRREFAEAVFPRMHHSGDSSWKNWLPLGRILERQCFESGGDVDKFLATRLSNILFRTRGSLIGSYRRVGAADSAFLGVGVSRLLPLGSTFNYSPRPGILFGATAGQGLFSFGSSDRVRTRTNFSVAFQDVVPDVRPADGDTGFTVHRWRWRLGVEGEPWLSDSVGAAFGGFLAVRFLPRSINNNNLSATAIRDITELRVSAGHRHELGRYLFLSVSRSF